MSGSDAAFPEAFRDLESLADWALPTERARYEMRSAASRDALQAFYDLMAPRIEAVIASFEGLTLTDLPEPERRLLWLSFSMVEVAFAIEKYGGVGRVPYAIDLDQMIPLHDS